MILPYYDYADVIFMFSNENLLKKLDRLHIRGLKISGKITDSISDEDLLNSSNISNLENRRKVHLRNFLYNRKHKCYVYNEMDNRMCTRMTSGPTFIIEKPNCEAYKRSVCYSGYNEWNSIDPDIRSLDNSILFKRYQKSWLINTYLF